jgi:hypothetical protein
VVPINIDFSVLSYVVIGLFALIGFTRGWFREALTTILLMFMVFLLAQPTLATKLVTTLGILVSAFLKPLMTSLGSNSAIADLINAIKGLFNVDNPYSFLLLATGFLIVFSLLVGQRALSEGRLAPLSRILGGTLGALNGFVVVSLGQKYLFTRLGVNVSLGLGAPGSVQAQAPQQVPLTLQNLNALPVAGITLILLLVIGFVILIFFLRELRIRTPSRRRGAKE